MARSKLKFDWRFFVLLPIPLLWALAAQFGYLQVAEDRTLDWRFRARGPIDAPVPIIYVDIDAQAIEELGNFPWPRSNFAVVCGGLINQGRAKAIGIDILFSENGVSESYDRTRWVQANLEFARFLRKEPPVAVAASYAVEFFRGAQGRESRQLPLVADGLTESELGNLPELPEFSIGNGRFWSPPQVGLIDTIGGSTRWVPLYAPTSVRRYDHMALTLALLYWGRSPADVVVTDEALHVNDAQGQSLARVPLTQGQFLEINWFSPWLSSRNPRTSFSVVYNYTKMLASDDEKARANAQEFFRQFEGAIVLIGPVDPLLQDLAVTSFDNEPVPKVGVHGNLIKTIVSGLYLQRLPLWSLYVICVVLGTVVMTLAMVGGPKGLWSKLGAFVILGGYAGAAFLLFKTSHLVLPLTAPIGGALSMAFAGIMWQLVREEKQKGRIKGMFGAYVSPELVDRLVQADNDPQLGGHDAEITAYFSDIQSFSSFSEKLGSGPLVDLMNEYLTACTDIVQSEGGTLDKYIGDAVVAMFGAPVPLPDHALRACIATQKVHRQLAELREKWRAETGKWPPIVHNMQTRIGLNSGVCMIGNMGSRSRFNYTMMGDNVNLAARMESGAKSWGAYTMCTEATKLACEQHGPGRLVFRPLARIVVKGRQQAVPVYEIVGLAEHVSDRTRECVRLFEAALARYYERDWAGALALFAQSRELEPNVPGQTPGVSSNPSLVYLERIVPEAMEEPPPADWDGRYIMKEK